MKISNWLFRWWYVMKLKEQMNSPFKMKLETDALKSNCVSEIQNEIEPLWLSIKKLIYKLGVKSIQNNRTRIYRDEFGKELILPNPVFSENQIAEIKTKQRLYLIIIICFTIAESFLYYLTASLFVPGGSIWMKISVAVFLALLIMFALNYAFEKHFLYREAVERHSRNELNDHQLKRFQDTRNIGYFIIALCFAAIIFAGLSRVFFLENIPANGLGAAKLLSIQKASKMASILTMVVTFITAIFMASLKQDQGKYGMKLRVFKSWHNAHVRRNEYTQHLIKDANSIMLITEQYIEKYWQLVIDLKRVYNMENEYDAKYQQLHQEYDKLKAKSGFVLNKDLYRKFSPIQCVDDFLFRYGVVNDEHIKEKVSFAVAILSMPKEHITEHLQTLTKVQDSKPLLTDSFSKNGKSIEQEIISP